MKFYTVKQGYAEYLHTIDNKVPNVVDQNYKNPKPFVGVVLEIDNHKYLAPLTSPKEWHSNITNSNVNYFKIHENGDAKNYLGMINFKFMIPVIESEISLIDIENISKETYKNLFYNQLEFIRPNDEKIKRKAKLLRELVLAGKMKNTCDFSALEANYKNYISS